jgi:enamine deaminase RidA (YjgF/YER057c/UK114 family)
LVNVIEFCDASQERRYWTAYTTRKGDNMLKTSLFLLTTVCIAVFGISATAVAQSSSTPEARLKEKNITLPAVPAAGGNYVDTVRVGNLLFVAGNTSRDGAPLGKVGKDLTVEQGAQAARYAGLLLLAKTRAALGSLDRIKRVVKVVGMVSSTDGFGEQPRVMNGFSDLLIEVFGDAGKHARTSIGVNVLPGNAPVEVEAIFEVE